jgi:hypothetical protein
VYRYQVLVRYFFFLHCMSPLSLTTFLSIVHPIICMLNLHYFLLSVDKHTNKISKMHYSYLYSRSLKVEE